jgi:beta-galactosidase
MVRVKIQLITGESVETKMSMSIRLDGQWEAGIDREYDQTVNVPGIVTDPGRMTEGTLWYRREVELPDGDWTHAVLVLNGARFCPVVYINGDKVSSSHGGMTVTVHPLDCQHIFPGNRINLEIALSSMKDIDPQDASYIPPADHWRSNISSCLWDMVSLELHKGIYVSRLVPYVDLERDEVTLRWEASFDTNMKAGHLSFEVRDDHGALLAEAVGRMEAASGQTILRLNGACQTWSPDAPHCYRLIAKAYMADGSIAHIKEQTLGLKEFRTEGKKFRLNGKPVSFRAGSLVWHRWVRDPEARELAFDSEWFERHIILRLKGHGANGIRFHLGTPPEALLDLCDKHGLMVQAEWSFFHGLNATEESMMEQWRNWLDLCMRHPSISIIHPWNETEGEELEAGFRAIEGLTKEYPPLVIAHRDVLHVHKYWWGLFENVGLYYDSADQFPMPIVADEFGGNYLDGEGEPGGYFTLKESFLRFLGRHHTKELRLQLNCESNTQIAEYWRRLGAAGFSPFVMLSSWEDGNHHFLGKLEEGRPKPVWDGLTAAYSPVSVSLEVWDRNFVPNQKVELPLYWFNETDETRQLRALVSIQDSSIGGMRRSTVELVELVEAYGMKRTMVQLQLPSEAGEWKFCAELLNGPDAVIHPIVSSWRFRTMTPIVPDKLKAAKVAVLPGDEELVKFASNCGLSIADADDAQLLIVPSAYWEAATTDPQVREILEYAIDQGRSVVMLNCGPIKLGQGYLPGDELGPLQEIMKVEQPKRIEAELVHGIGVSFKESAEPESCIHPTDEGLSIFQGLDRQSTWLWNGYRGGLIVPACEMEISGLNANDFVRVWEQRGADIERLTSGSYYSFELCGFYAFDTTNRSSKVEKDLQDKVRLLFDDAPALQHAINPDAPVRVYDLSRMYRESLGRKAQKMTALAECGVNLTKKPVLQIEFGDGKGKLLLSQLLTDGRLADGYGTDGLYGVRKDPAAQQFVLNLLSQALPDSIA